MLAIEVTVDLFVITAGTFKYTTPIRVPMVKVVVQVDVKYPAGRIVFAVEVEELAE